MATNDHTTRTWKYRLGMIAAGLGLVLLGALTAATAPASGQADLTLGELHVEDVNRTVDGNVSDVTVTADLDYQFDVPDATRWIVRLRVGPTADQLETLTFRQDDDPGGTGSGTVTLSGSVTDTQAFTAGDFDPALASTEETSIVVAADLEVRRANGDPVTATVTQPVNVTLRDGASLSAQVGGSGNVTVSTA